VIGYENDTREIGRIDLLARHKRENQWLVVELKRNQTSDDTIGQTLRYMGWVSQNLAKSDDYVKGMIICHESDSRIKYALNFTKNVDLLLYEVEFRLRKG
jgi:RecB family endonuclease NucS